MEEIFDGVEEIQIEEAMRRSLEDQKKSPGKSQGSRTQTLNLEKEEDILYSVGRVCIDPQPGTPRTKVEGNLSLTRLNGDIFLQWKPKLPGNDGYKFHYNLAEIYSLRRKGSKLYVMLLEHGEPGVSLPPLAFEGGASSVRDFLAYMQANLEAQALTAPFLRIDPADGNRYLVQRAPVQSHFTSDLNVHVEQATNMANNVARNVQLTIFEKASGVARIFRNAMHEMTEPQKDQSKHLDLDRSIRQKLSLSEESTNNVPSTNDLECRERAALGELGDFDYICEVKPLNVLDACERTSPVDEATWNSFFDEDMNLDEKKMRIAVFKGGVVPELRRTVWFALLGHRPGNGEEATSFYAERKKMYETMKMQWVEVTTKQLDNNSGLRERLERVAKDVSRTDRDDDFYLDADSPNLMILNDVLCTWCMYNFDLGYVQGMSDILSVILKVVRDEADAFWCFVGLMDTEHGLQANFALDQKGMNGHLDDLKKLLRFVDPPLMDYLEKNDSGNLFFMFRWLLIFFKREFKYDDVIVLWEVLWTRAYSPKFHLFVCLAMVAEHRDEIIQKKMCFDELLAYVNGLQKSFDLNQVLGKAESIRNHISTQENVPEHIKEYCLAFGTTTEELETGGEYIQSYEYENPPCSDNWKVLDHASQKHLARMNEQGLAMDAVCIYGEMYSVDLTRLHLTHVSTGQIHPLRCKRVLVDLRDWEDMGMSP
eukprot:m.32981 g.32981  ORF g.32981 m.32981 type:complete len:710 (+) comp8475_c0_seq1:237-2366(+)